MIQNSVYHQPNSMENSATSSQPSGATGDKSSSGKNFDSGNYRGIMQEPSLFKPIPAKAFHNSRTNEETSNSRLQKTESVHSSSALQDGRGTSAERIHRKRRFYSKTRLKGCIYSSPHTSSRKTLSGISKPRNKVHLSGFKFRIEYSSQYFLKATKVRLRTNKKRRNSASIISRRYHLLRSGSRQGAITGISKQDNETSGVIRISSKQNQECTNSTACPKLPRLYLRHQEDDYKGGTGKEASKLTTAASETNITDDTQNMQMDGRSDDGQDDSYDSGNAGSSPSHSIFAEGSDENLTRSLSKLGDGISLVEGSERRDTVAVAEPYNEERRRANQTRQIPIKVPTVTIYTDSSETGWGITSTFMKTHGYWKEEEKQWSINVRELMVIHFALKLHGPNFRNRTIKIFTDNTTSIKYTTKAGGSASPLFQEIAIKIQELCNKFFGIEVYYQHVKKGILNTEAGTLSRKQVPVYERRLPRRIVLCQNCHNCL